MGIIETLTHDTPALAGNSTDVDNELDGPIQYVLIIISVIAMIFIVGGNTLVILTVCLTRELREEVTNILVANLALADMMFGMQNIPTVILLVQPDAVDSSTSCLIYLITMVTLTLTSVATLTGKSYAIKHYYHISTIF